MRQISTDSRIYGPSQAKQKPYCASEYTFAVIDEHVFTTIGFWTDREHNMCGNSYDFTVQEKIFVAKV